MDGGVLIVLLLIYFFEVRPVTSASYVRQACLVDFVTQVVRSM